MEDEFSISEVPPIKLRITETGRVVRIDTIKN